MSLRTHYGFLINSNMEDTAMDELNYKDAYLFLVRAVDDLVRYMELSDETADRKTVLAGLRQALSGAEDRAIG